MDDASRGANAIISIDLEKQEIRGPDGGVVKFDIDPHRKHTMLNGLDDIGLTKLKQDKIDSFEASAKAARSNAPGAPKGAGAAEGAAGKLAGAAKPSSGARVAESGAVTYSNDADAAHSN